MASWWRKGACGKGLFELECDDFLMTGQERWITRMNIIMNSLKLTSTF